MIYVEKGKVYYNGGNLTLMQDICCAMQLMADEKIADKEFLHHAVDTAFMTEEEIEADTERLKKKLAEEIADFAKFMEHLNDITESDNDYLDDDDDSDDENFEKMFRDIL